MSVTWKDKAGRAHAEDFDHLIYTGRIKYAEKYINDVQPSERDIIRLKIRFFLFFVNYFLKGCYSIRSSRALVATVEFLSKLCTLWHTEGSVGHHGGVYRGYNTVRERRIPERINRNSLGTMVGQGPLGNAIVLLFPRRPAPTSPGGKR